MNITKTIQDLSEIQGTNNKKDFILKHKDDEGFLKLLEIAYSPYIVLGIKKVQYDKDKNVAVYQNKLKEFLNLVMYLTSHNTNQAVRDLVTKFLNSCSTLEADIYHKILSSTLKIGIGVSTINSALGYTLIPHFKVMLANPEPDTHIYDFPVILEEKLDGVRITFVKKDGEVSAYTRKGKYVHLPRAFKQLKTLSADNFMLDSELTSSNRLSVTGIVNKILKGNKGTDLDKDLVVNVFDIMCVDIFLQRGESKIQMERSIEVEVFLTNNIGLSAFKQVKQSVAHSYGEIKIWYDMIRKAGGEGVIVKNPKAIYEFKRSSAWIKLKAIQSCTLEIIGKYIGKEGGQFEQALGGFMATTSCRTLETNVGGGFTPAQRDEFWPLNMNGRFIEVIYNELERDDDGNFYLFLGRFKEVRLDKTEADSFAKLLQESQSHLN